MSRCARVCARPKRPGGREPDSSSSPPALARASLQLQRASAHSGLTSPLRLPRRRPELHSSSAGGAQGRSGFAEHHPASRRPPSRPPPQPDQRAIALASAPPRPARPPIGSYQLVRPARRNATQPIGGCHTAGPSRPRGLGPRQQVCPGQTRERRQRLQIAVSPTSVLRSRPSDRPRRDPPPCASAA